MGYVIDPLSRIIKVNECKCTLCNEVFRTEEGMFYMRRDETDTVNTYALCNECKKVVKDMKRGGRT